MNYLTGQEKRTSAALATVYLLRIFSLIAVVPFFMLYAQKLEASTPLLAGTALGAFGLTAAICYSLWHGLSYRLGRKTVIILSLLALSLGSLVAAIAGDIFLLILGRALQGAGAVGATILALNADCMNPTKRSQATAIIGACLIGSFLAAMLLGTVLYAHIGINGLFIIGTVLPLLAIFVLLGVCTNSPKPKTHRDLDFHWDKLGSIFARKRLMRLNLGVFILFTVFIATFVELPIILAKNSHLPIHVTWWLFVPAIIVALVIVFPSMVIAQRFRQLKRSLTLSIVLMAIAQILFQGYNDSASLTVVALVLFFAAFTVLITLLPTWLDKEAPLLAKGTALHVYTIFQYLGVFAGGILGGALIDMGVSEQVFLVCLALLALWFIMAGNTPPPLHVATRLAFVGQVQPDKVDTLEAKLLQLDGVVEAVVVISDEIAYLRVDADILPTEEDINTVLATMPAYD